MLSAFVQILAGAALYLFCFAAAAQGVGQGAGQGGRLAAPALEIKCIVVRDAGLTGRRPDTNGAPRLRLGTGSTVANDRCKALGRSTGALTGAGDLLVAVESDDFEATQVSGRRPAGDFVLLLNGVPLPTNASLLALEDVGDLVVLRYRVSQGKESQKLWAILYKDSGLLATQPLYAALAWRRSGTEAVTTIPERSKVHAAVRVTTLGRFAWAGILVGLTVLTVIFVARRSDTLRDAATPEWLLRAKRLQRELVRSGNAEAHEKRIRESFQAYDPADREHYDSLADRALAGEEIDAEKTPAAVIGLALRTGDWPLVRGTYSLSRTQLALWFTFTVATALFLWLVYGELAKIDNSLLLLLGISGGTAAVAWAADRNAGGRRYQPSEGFWADLVTGFDHENSQLHRYQAVVVNLLLLTVGIHHVAQQLTYPVFDETWLIFLGVSGATYGAGKHILESAWRPRL